MNWAIDEDHCSNLNWRQNFPCHNIHILYIQVWEKAADALQELARVGDLVFPEQQQQRQQEDSNHQHVQQPHQFQINQFQEYIDKDFVKQHNKSGYIITWMLLQIIMYSILMKLVAG